MMILDLFPYQMFKIEDDLEEEVENLGQNITNVIFMGPSIEQQAVREKEEFKKIPEQNNNRKNIKINLKITNRE